MTSTTEPDSPLRRRCLIHFGHITLLLVFIGVVYYPSLHVPFFFDDIVNIVENPAVQPDNWDQLGEVMNSPVSGSRPFALATFAMNYLLGGLDVFGYHLVNTAVHALTTLILYTILFVLPLPCDNQRRETGSNHVRLHLAFWGALLWAVNPVQTQAVTYIVQQMTSLATLWYLLAMLAFIGFRRRRLAGPIAFPLIGICFLLGMASKENVITLPLSLLLLHCLFFKPFSPRRHLLILAVILCAVLFISSFYISPLPDFFSRYPNRDFSPWERLLTQCRIVWYYAGLFILPLPGRLHLAHDPEISRSLVQPWTTAAGFAAILLTLYLAWRWRRRPAVAFGIVFFFLAQAVESSFLNLEPVFIHRLYLSSAFLPFGVLTLLPRSWLNRPAWPFLILILAFWSYWAMDRNLEWRHPRNFWKAEHIRGAGENRALNNLAVTLMQQGRYRQAIPVLEQSLAAAGDRKEVLVTTYNLASAHLYAGNNRKSAELFTQIREESGPVRQTGLLLGKASLELGRIQQVEQLAAELVRHPGLNYQGKILEALLAEAAGDRAAALNIIRQTIKKMPAADLTERVTLTMELGRLQLAQGRMADSLATFEEVAALVPEDYQVRRNIDLIRHLLEKQTGSKRPGRAHQKPARLPDGRQ